MGFDAGEAVSDGLFLSFLECESVVECAGDQIGQGSEQQDFFFGEINVVGRFDVKYAVKLFRKEDG